MAQRIKADVLKALDDWKAGKPVKSLELGHVHRMQERGQFSPVIDFSKRLSNDQERAHAYCFKVIEEISSGKATICQHNASDGSIEKYRAPENHDEFLDLCHTIEEAFRLEDDSLTPEEAIAVESLAWKALHVGWARAIAGHDPSRYIEVTNPKVVQTT